MLALLVLGGLFLTLRPDPQAARDQSFDLNITGGKLTPSQITVGEGDRVTLRITADKDMELHLHGVDREIEVESGETQEITFEATPSGGFPIEDHGTEAQLGRLVIQPREGS